MGKQSARAAVPKTILVCICFVGEVHYEQTVSERGVARRF